MLVEYVLVAFVVVRPPLNASAVVVALLGNKYENELPPENERQVLFTEKQPPERLIPVEKVEVADPF